MAVKSADQISIVDLTDGYSVNLTTDSYTFAGDTTKVKSTQTFSTTIYGYCGSSAVTAKKLGRHFVGIEQNPRYCVWCEKRLELASEAPGIQGYADGVFWERNTFAMQKRKK